MQKWEELKVLRITPKDLEYILQTIQKHRPNFTIVSYAKNITHKLSNSNRSYQLMFY